jgi:hypothetical protein
MTSRLTSHLTSHLTSDLSRCTAFVLVVACVLAAGCQDRQRPKPVTAHSAAAQAR